MIYNGKQVYTPETFKFNKAVIGDYVSQEITVDGQFRHPHHYC